jgi:hypothetical protein
MQHKPRQHGSQIPVSSTQPRQFERCSRVSSTEDELRSNCQPHEQDRKSHLTPCYLGNLRRAFNAPQPSQQGIWRQNRRQRTLTCKTRRKENRRRGIPVPRKPHENRRQSRMRLPAWLMLEKQLCVFALCSQTWDFFKHFRPKQADDRGAMQMATAQQPTRRTRHIDMKQFVILQWSEEDLISFADCPSALLVADLMTKQTGRTKFHEHTDMIVGRRRPHPPKCAINVFSASHNLRQLRCDKIVSSMAG